MNNTFWGRVWRGKIQNVKIIIVVTKSKFLTQFFNDVKSHDYYIPTTLCLFPQYMPGRNPKDGAKIKWHGGRAPHHHSPLYIHSIGQSSFKIGVKNSSYEFSGYKKVIDPFPCQFCWTTPFANSLKFNLNICFENSFTWQLSSVCL